MATCQSGKTSLLSDGTTAWSNPTHIQVNKHKTKEGLKWPPQALQKTGGLKRQLLKKIRSIKLYILYGFHLVFYTRVYSKWLFDGSRSVFKICFTDVAQWCFPPSLPGILENMLLFLRNQRKSFHFLTSVFYASHLKSCFHADLVPNNNMFLIECIYHAKEKSFPWYMFDETKLLIKLP